MKRRNQSGFTAIELMIVLGVVGLTVAASWGRIQNLTRQHQLTSTANKMATHLRLAREKAVSEGNNYIVTFTLDGNGYQVWDDEGSDAVDGPDDSRQDFSMPKGASIEAASFFGSNRLTFRSDGTSSASGTVQITNGEYSREISVLASTGKISVLSP